MELRYEDLEERYRTRLLYALQPEDVAQCTHELQDASGVRSAWLALVDDADRVDYSLEETKKLFAETTKKQVHAGPSLMDTGLRSRTASLVLHDSAIFSSAPLAPRCPTSSATPTSSSSGSETRARACPPSSCPQGWSCSRATRWTPRLASPLA